MDIFLERCFVLPYNLSRNWFAYLNYTHLLARACVFFSL